MRTLLKETIYFERYKSELVYIIERSKVWIKEGKVPIERVKITKDGIRSNYLYLAISKYTADLPSDGIYNDLVSAIQLVEESWSGLWKLKLSSGEVLNQYILSAYDEMLWMLSMSYLLEVPNHKFQKLVDVIDRDGVKDYLYEFIIQAKIQNRNEITEESYKDYYNIPKAFEKLRHAIIETDKPKAEKLVKEFITKDWYKNHKDAGWYDSHKSKHDTYFGYWSFETAAIVKIMGLDDSSFKDCAYYPKDLVAFEDMM